MILRGGGLVFGLIAGYLISGFLMCVLQTLPWHENFMNFEYKIDAEKGSQAMRKFLPPDRLWLAMIQRASIGSFRTGQEEEMTPFDKNATFEIRYARYRRYGEGREALTHQGECKAREDQ